MITNLTLENFKAFQKLDNLEIKPITILCGTNSCGKSSILQSLLLFKQTLENNKPNQNLLLNGEYIRLGRFQDLIYKKVSDNNISFKFDIEVSRTDSHEASAAFMLLESLAVGVGAIFFKKDKNPNRKLRVIYNLDFILEKQQDFEGDLANKPITEYVEIQIFDISDENEELEIHLKYQLMKDGRHQIEQIKNNNNNWVEYLDPNEDLSTLSPKEQMDKNFKKQSFQEYWKLTDLLLKSSLGQYHYIGSLRGEPEREYIFRDEVLEIGNKGENAAYLFLKEYEKEIENHYFYNKKKDDFEVLDQITLVNGMRKWLDLMNIKDLDVEIINRIIYLSLNASKIDKTKVGIADVGFGVSQIFPIILEGLRMEKGDSLILEQPEIHLHPNLQMQMADYFISLALSGKNVLAETHSDHVVNRLVRRIVEDETGKLNDLIAIYFIKPSEDGATYEPIQIDESKGIVNWPDGFFDQAANEQMRIMQAGLKKRKQKRSSNR